MTEPEDTYGDEALAAEYVLHLLDADDRRAFETRLKDDQVLRVQVTQWEAHFAGMAEAVDAVQPPARIKSAVMETIAEARGQARSSLWRPWAMLLGGLAIAGLAAVLLMNTVFTPELDLTPAFRADLSSGDQSIVLVASVIPATHEIVVEPVTGAPPSGRVFELWLIAEGATTPISLGVLETGDTTRIRVPDEIAPSVRTGTIAISDEPPGGSPTGAPTGPVHATALFEDI